MILLKNMADWAEAGVALHLPVEITGDVIDRISGGSCLFIYGIEESYFVEFIFHKQ